MKNYLIVVACFFICTIYSQKNTFINGFVSFDSNPLEDVYIKNISTNDNTITDSLGQFRLNSKVGDTLFFSYLGMNNITKILSEYDFLNSNLSIEMFKHSFDLEEVVLHDNSKFSSLSMGIIPNDRKTLTLNERRLKASGDFKPIHLLSLLGGKLDFDPILNSINGRTKHFKKNIEIEKKVAILDFLKTNYNEYINKDLKITSEEDIGLFYCFLVDFEDIVEKINNNNDLKLKFLICKALVEFRKLNEGLLTPSIENKE